jgi:hypothetical protein
MQRSIASRCYLALHLALRCMSPKVSRTRLRRLPAEHGSSARHFSRRFFPRSKRVVDLNAWVADGLLSIRVRPSNSWTTRKFSARR